jgi:hypothetical protein
MWPGRFSCHLGFAAYAVLAMVSGGAVCAQMHPAEPLPQPEAAWHEWLRTRLPEGKGPYDFAIALFTGNMSRDPVHAEAQRRLASTWLNITLLPGDTLVLAGAEHRVWTMGKPLIMDGSAESRRLAFSMLPAGPAPGSQGGKSIEAALAELADRVATPPDRGSALIMLSNGWSQDGNGAARSVEKLTDLG